MSEEQSPQLTVAEQTNQEQAPPEQTGPWYRDGLPFTCSQCGDCCTGPPGVVEKPIGSR